MSYRKETKFKETEIGPIPEEWDVLPLSDFADLIKDSYIPSVLENIPYIGLEHIDQQTLSLNSVGISSDTKSIKFQFKEDDVLFGKLRPYFRKVYRSGLSGVCSTDIWVIRKKENSDSRFLFYLLASDEFIQSANISSGGTRMPRADWGHLKKTCWPFPPLDEQKRIAEILSSLDEKIELNRKMSKTLEEIAQALFKRWFVDFEFPADSASRNQAGEPIEPGKPYKSSGGKMIDSDLGLIPEGWREYRFDELMQFLPGKYIPKSHYELDAKNYIYGSNSVMGKTSQKTQDGPIIVLAKIGSYCGAIRYSFDDCWINNNAGGIKGKEISTSLAYEILKAFDFGSVREGSGQPYINMTSLKEQDIMLPESLSSDIILNFISAIDECYRKIGKVLNEIDNLSSIRDSLLSRLMSGKIRT